jgi:hypothetical protein
VKAWHAIVIAAPAIAVSLATYLPVIRECKGRGAVVKDAFGMPKCVPTVGAPQ